jgi:SAM-dependent methyltransferase
MPLFALTIFGSAFLLFLVQPIIAKEILPWFGGSAAVWTTCMVFFQCALLAGYAYADVLARRLTPRRQTLVHVALLVASLAVLPIIPAAHWKPSGADDPIASILGLLVVTLGLPFFLLSTTSPLLQSWFALRYPGRNPYRLFALSNLASLLALVAYPFVIEPSVATRMQAHAWSIGYVAFVVLCAATAWRNLRARDARVREAEHAMVPAPGLARQVLWCALAATSSVLLLAVTSHLTQNIAAVPLLWVVPLAIYLSTFILCFESPRLYPREALLPIAAAALGVMAWCLADSRLTHELWLQIAVFSLGLFVVCMFCHGELALCLVGAAVLLAWQVRRDALVFPLLAGIAFVATVGCGLWRVSDFYDDTLLATRNFYGVLRVQQFGDGRTEQRSLVSGTIMHGVQYVSPAVRRQPTSYYTTSSGIGRLLDTLHPRMEPLRVGVIGLGTGTLAAYGTPGDLYRFYDINPAVIAIARRDFTYLADSDAHVETPLGDARLTLEREPPAELDVLAVDAFSSDAIPVHLITKEALALYARQLRADGVVAFHVTNRFLDLVPVVDGIARANGMEAVWIHDEGDAALANRSDWVLVSRNHALLASPRIATAASPIPPHPEWRVWTDDFNNLFEVLRR